jgi:hypothetical protein
VNCRHGDETQIDEIGTRVDAYDAVESAYEDLVASGGVPASSEHAVLLDVRLRSILGMHQTLRVRSREAVMKKLEFPGWILTLVPLSG